MMKKIYNVITFTILLLLSIAIYFCYTQNIEISKLKENILAESTSYPEIYDTVISVNYNNFDLFLEQKKDSKVIVYVGRPTCPDCHMFEPLFIEFINQYKLNDQIIYLNVAEVRNNELEWDIFTSKYDLMYVPTIAIFENLEMIAKIEWTPEKGISIASVKDWFKSNNLIEYFGADFPVSPVIGNH